MIRINIKTKKSNRISIENVINHLVNKKVLVGIQSDSRRIPTRIDYGKGQLILPTNAELGRIHELGIGVPKREFLKPSVYLSRTIINSIIKQSNNKKVSKSFVLPMLNKIGKSIKDNAKKIIDLRMNLKELSEYTLRERIKYGYQHDDPLYLSGQMYDAIEYRIVNKNESS